MANTGKKIVLTLKQVNSITFAPTGLTEANDPADGSDYIPPYNDFVTCPISYSLACPLPIIVGYTGSIGFEFSLFNSVIDNPRVTKVTVISVSGSTPLSSVNFPIPNSTPNYFSGSVTAIPGPCSIQLQYFSGSVVIGSCAYTASVIVH